MTFYTGFLIGGVVGCFVGVCTAIFVISILMMAKDERTKDKEYADGIG